MKTREAVVNLITSWIGKNEADGSFKSIIDTYNTGSNLPRGIKMTYSWSWCACTWSALAIKLGYTDIMPIEISCGFLIAEAKKMGVWKENDDYVASPGDAILYDWDDNGKGDDTGWPDHVGTIVYTGSGYYVVVEGNHDNAVKKRTISINGKFIRGFITPKYDAASEVTKVPVTSGKSVDEVAHEVIVGQWGTMPSRKVRLEGAGYNYEEVRSRVNEILNRKANHNSSVPAASTVASTCNASYFSKSVAGTYKTTANVYCRNDAGTNKTALCLIPKGTLVSCYGYYSVAVNKRWLLIQVTVNGVKYVGFSCLDYLRK